MKVSGLFHNANEVQDVPAGTVIFAEGEDGKHMFGIIEGVVQLKNDRGLDLRLEADDVFGEMALVDHTLRSATATATVDTKLAVLDDHRFLFLVHETPMFALQVMRTMAERLRAPR